MITKASDGWIVLFLRVGLGMIFIALGFTKTFLWDGGISEFVSKVFVENYSATWLPEPLLWVAGYADALGLLILGLALFVGLQTRWASIGASALMLMMIFGHLVKNPFFDFSGKPLPYLAIALIILHFESRGNYFSLDSLMNKRTRKPAVSEE